RRLNVRPHQDHVRILHPRRLRQPELAEQHRPVPLLGAGPERVLQQPGRLPGLPAHHVNPDRLALLPPQDPGRIRQEVVQPEIVSRLPPRDRRRVARRRHDQRCRREARNEPRSRLPAHRSSVRSRPRHHSLPRARVIPAWTASRNTVPSAPRTPDPPADRNAVVPKPCACPATSRPIRTPPARHPAPPPTSTSGRSSPPSRKSPRASDVYRIPPSPPRTW